jgi:hypothetical protein
MPVLRITRNFEFINYLIKYTVRINEKKATKLKNGETQELDLPPGEHTLRAHIYWPFTSPPLKITLNPEDVEKNIFIATNYNESNMNNMLFPWLNSGRYLYIVNQTDNESTKKLTEPITKPRYLSKTTGYINYVTGFTFIILPFFMSPISVIAKLILIMNGISMFIPAYYSAFKRSVKVSQSLWNKITGAILFFITPYILEMNSLEVNVFLTSSFLMTGLAVLEFYMEKQGKIS